MTEVTFAPATRHQVKARIGLSGPPGAGKTYTALAIASGLGERIAVIDTERGSASLYADEFAFDVLEITPPYDPIHYVKALQAAERGGFEVVVVDSLTHAWSGSGGVLEMVDTLQARDRNKMQAWATATPKWRGLLDAMLGSRCHVIFTTRSKTEWIIEPGKDVRKVGLAPEARDGIEFEVTVFGDIDMSHRMAITKSRLKPLQDKVLDHPGAEVGRLILAELQKGESSGAAPISGGMSAGAPDPSTPDEAGTSNGDSGAALPEEGGSAPEGEDGSPSDPDAKPEQMERAAALYGSKGLLKVAYHDTFGHVMRTPSATEIEKLILAKAGASA